jgi:hypothetical protein
MKEAAAKEEGAPKKEAVAEAARMAQRAKEFKERHKF